jgi:hypothetical protein
VLAWGAIPLGQRRLGAGNHELSFLVRRKNPVSSVFHFGIDALVLAPLEPSR